MTETTTLALLVLVFVAVALVLVTTLSLVPATADRARGLWPVLISEVVIVAVALGVILPGGLVTGLGIALLAGRCGFEAATVVFPPAAERPIAPLALGAAAAIATGLAAVAGSVGTAAALVLVAAAIAIAVRRAPPPRPADAVVLVAFPFAALVAFAAVAARPGGTAILLLAFLLVETMDSAAVLGGRLFGRHKAFPRLSPRKTVEGLVAGAVAVAGATLVLGLAVMGWSLGRILVVAATAAVTTVTGDLTASWIKRRAGVKDYPPIHPVQGGVLDIVDAWIVTAPALAMVASFA